MWPAYWARAEPARRAEKYPGHAEEHHHRPQRPRSDAAQDRGGHREPSGEHEAGGQPPAPARRSGPGIAGVAPVTARRVSAVEVAAPVGFDQMQQLVRDVAFAAPEAADALVHGPDEETLAGEPAIRADARPVLEQIVLPGSSGDGGDLDDARHALDRRQRNAHRRALDRLHVDPAESELRPRAHLRWMLAALDPGPLPHEA